MIQSLITALLVLWAAWHVFGRLAPWRQRRARAWLARRLDGRAPVRLVAALRPGMPITGCGCGNSCSEPARVSDVHRA
jgi:hypothetical protein